jgi:uncharacterized protein YndB with AHSA1/START domain
VGEAPTRIYVVYIRTTPERLWSALVSPEGTRDYSGGRFESTWQPGAVYRTYLDDGSTIFEGTVLEANATRRLVYTFRYLGADDARAEQPSRVTWQIDQIGYVCKLTVVHDNFAAGERHTYDRVGSGWPIILSSLKTYLETGRALRARAS